MLIAIGGLTELQRDMLRATLAGGGLTRARGGYVAAPGTKPFSVRTIMAMQRMGLITFGDGSRKVALTIQGSRLLLEGKVELPEEQAG